MGPDIRGVKAEQSDRQPSERANLLLILNRNDYSYNSSLETLTFELDDELGGLSFLERVSQRALPIRLFPGSQGNVGE